MFRHPLQHEQIEPDRRRHLCHLDNHHDEDAEPYDIDPGLPDHRLDNGHGQDNRGNAVKEHAKDDVEDGQRRDQNDGRQVHAVNPPGKRPWQAGESHRQRQKGRAHQDQRDHRRGAGCPHQAGKEGLKGQRPLHQRKRQRADHADGRGLCCCGPAEIHRTDDDEDKRHHRRQEPAVLQHSGKTHRGFRLWPLSGAEIVPANDVGHEQPGQHKPGNDAGQEQLGDRFIDRHAIDNQCQRWRDHEPQCSRPGQRADDHIFGIAALAKLGNRHLADRRQCRGGGSGHGGKDRAAGDIGMQKSSRKPPHPGRQPAEHILGQSRSEENLAHPDEQRQRRQCPARRPGPDCGDHRITSRARGEQLHPDIGDADKRQPDPDRASEKREHRKQEDRGGV